MNNCDTLFTNTVDFFPMLSQLIKTSRLSDLSLLVDLCTFPRSYNLSYLKRLRKSKREGENV